MNTALTQVLAQHGGGTTTRFLPGIGQQVNGAWQYLHADALGNLRQVTDASGAVLGSRRYSPFGEVVAGTGSLSPLGFTGEHQDGASSLTYLRARYYNAALGRFLTPDAIVPDAANGQAWNAYAYAYNDVVNLVDHSGFDPGPPNPISICTSTPICSSISTNVSDLVGNIVNSAGQMMNQVGTNISNWWNKPSCSCKQSRTEDSINNVAFGAGIAGAAYLGVVTTAAERTSKLVMEQKHTRFGLFSLGWRKVQQFRNTYDQIAKVLPEGGVRMSDAKSSGWFRTTQKRMRSVRDVQIGKGSLGIAGSLIGGAALDGLIQFFWNDSARCLSGSQRLYNAGVAALAGLGAAAVGALVTVIILGAAPVAVPVGIVSATAVIAGTAAGWAADSYGPIADARQRALIK